MTHRIYEDCFGDWQSIRNEFSPGWDSPPDDFIPEEPLFVFAVYSFEVYDGSAFVVYSNDGVTFWVAAGSHCSCYGLEGQWDPDETTAEALRVMFEGGAPYGCPNAYSKQFLEWLDEVAV